jgi:hypothetical protein
LVSRQPSFVVVAVVSITLAAVTGLGVAMLWASRAPLTPKAAGGSGAPSTSTATRTEPGITLHADGSRAAAGERINLTGSAGGSGVALEVQERVNGAWVDFPAHGTTRSDGSFASYVLFGRAGEHVLRMVAPRTGTLSNPVTVTID